MVVFDYLKEVYWRGFFLFFVFLTLFGAFFSYREEYFYFLGGNVLDLVESSFIYTGVGEVFLAYLWMSLFFSSVITFWYFVLNSYFFLVSGLYVAEAVQWFWRIFFCFFAFCFCFKWLHRGLVYFFCWYFTSYGQGGGVSLLFEPRFGEFISFLLRVDVFIWLVLVGFLILFSFLYSYGLVVNRVRYGCYFFVVVGVVLAVPPDFFLHLMVFLAVVGGLEIIFFLICCKEAYNRRLIRLVELVDTVDSNSTP